MVTVHSTPPPRLLVPLSPRNGEAPPRCPVCSAARAPGLRSVLFGCGSGWPLAGEPQPCPRPPAAVILGRLRRWCQDEDLLEAAAFLRRRGAERWELARRDRWAPIWSQPRRTWDEPPRGCPCCGGTVAAVQPDRWNYSCGAQLLELSGASGASSGLWRAAQPCRHPPLTAVVAALAAVPHCPL